MATSSAATTSAPRSSLPGATSPAPTAAPANTVPGAAPAGSRQAVADLLLEEYKLLQGKIDKIGEFKFKVRGWSFTLVTALVVGTAKSDLTWLHIVALSVAMFLLLVAFNVMEQYQNELGRAFGKRATDIQQAIFRLTQGANAAMAASLMRRVGFSPQVANVAARAARVPLRRLAWRSVWPPSHHGFFLLQSSLLLLYALHPALRVNPRASEDVYRVDRIEVKHLGVRSGVAPPGDAQLAPGAVSPSTETGRPAADASPAVGGVVPGASPPPDGVNPAGTLPRTIAPQGATEPSRESTAQERGTMPAPTTPADPEVRPRDQGTGGGALGQSSSSPPVKAEPSSPVGGASDVKE